MASQLATPPQPELADGYFATAKAAAYIDKSARTMADWRLDPDRNRGPRFHRVNGRVVYKRSDLDSWVESGGLTEAQRVPPWEWRHGGTMQPVQPQRMDSSPESGFTCGAKRYCREMTSCDEARFYLERCGLSGLDDDGDGVPCESLCR
jgi:hypothetical protein